MVLANGETTVDDWLSFIGPDDPVDAVERQPESIRAMYESARSLSYEHLPCER